MTTSCDRWRDLIADAASGDPVIPALEAHLAACAACRQALGDGQALHARIDGELRLALSELPSPSLLPLVREQVSRGRARWLPLLLPVAAGLALFVFAISPWRRPAESTVANRPLEAMPPEAPLAVRSGIPGRPSAPGLARPPAPRAGARRDRPGTAAASIGSIPDTEPLRPAALVIAPLDAFPPIELSPLVTVGLDSEGAER